MNLILFPIGIAVILTGVVAASSLVYSLKSGNNISERLEIYALVPEPGQRREKIASRNFPLASGAAKRLHRGTPNIRLHHLTSSPSLLGCHLSDENRPGVIESKPASAGFCIPRFHGFFQASSAGFPGFRSASFSALVQPGSSLPN